MNTHWWTKASLFTTNLIGSWLESYWAPYDSLMIRLLQTLLSLMVTIYKGDTIEVLSSQLLNRKILYTLMLTNLSHFLYDSSQSGPLQNFNWLRQWSVEREKGGWSNITIQHVGKYIYIASACKNKILKEVAIGMHGNRNKVHLCGIYWRLACIYIAMLHFSTSHHLYLIQHMYVCMQYGRRS